MKKLVTLFAAVVACAAIVGGTASASTGGTVLARGFSCAVLDGNGSAFYTRNSSLTLYHNQLNTKVVMRCEGNGAGTSGDPKTVYFNYGNTKLACGFLFFATTDWSNKVGRNGNSQLTCTFTLSNDADVAAAASMDAAGLG